MRKSPFPSLIVLLRVFGKALLLLLVGNTLCLAAGVDPLARVYAINTWALTGHGRPRLYYTSDNQIGPLPVNAMLASHDIAYHPKAVDEFRVVVLGDSSALGWNLDETQHFSAQLTARGLHLQNRRVVAYNLAYPNPGVAKDVLIMDGALRYDPDLLIWFVTAQSFQNGEEAGNNTIIWNLNRARLRQLTADFNLRDWYNARMQPEPVWCNAVAICAPEALSSWLNTLTYPLFPTRWDTNQSRRVGSEDIPAKPIYTINTLGFEPMPNDTWRFLLVGQALAAQHKLPLLIVNEPTLIGGGVNSESNYSYYYQRALYDAYRDTLGEYVIQNHLWYIDLWNLIPKERFTDAAIHFDGQGWSLVVNRIATELAKAELAKKE